MRGKFRNSLDRSRSRSCPGEPTPVNFTLQDVDHTFRAGHRIMVQVQSTWFPLVDRNPQKFVDIYSAKRIGLPEGDPAGLPSRARCRRILRSWNFPADSRDRKNREKNREKPVFRMAFAHTK